MSRVERGFLRWALILAGVALGWGALAAERAEACTIWTNEGSIELHFPPGQPVVYYIQAAGSADIEGAEDFDAIHAAFAAWGSVLCGDQASGLTFEFGGVLDTDPNNYDPRRFRDRKNMVAFVNEGWEGDQGVLARARILWDGATGEIIEFGIGLNDEFSKWSTNPDGEADAFDIQAVLMRQIGLSFGLGDSEFEDSVMAPAFSVNNTSKRTLANDDVAAVCDLYAPGREDFATTPEDAECTRDFHPGAVPEDPNNEPGPDPEPEGQPDPEPEAQPDPEPEARTNLGPGENCLNPSECMEGLVCGCPLESCTANFCFTPEEPAPPPVKEKDDGCAQAGAPLHRSTWWPLLGLLAALAVLRRRA